MYYVFNYHKASGTVLPFKVPTIIAKLMMRLNKRWDYAPTPYGY